jgi:hypothetical protein
MSQSYKKDTNGHIVEPMQLLLTLRNPFRIELDKQHTYLMVFNKIQYASGIEALKTIPNLRVIYESVPANNRMHGKESANTLVLFEMDQ